MTHPDLQTQHIAGASLTKAIAPFLPPGIAACLLAWAAHPWRNTVVASLFMTCLSYLGHGLFAPFNAISYVALANVSQLATPPAAPVPKATTAPFVVVGISASRYTREYRGLSPLPRCQLRDDLRALYAAKPRSLAIDFDLSPTILAQTLADGGESAGCEAEITQLLADNSEITTVITPFPVEGQEFSQQKHQWMLKLCAKHLTFAEPFLNRGWGGVTYDWLPSPYALGNIVARRVQESRSDHGDAAENICSKLKELGTESPASVGNGYLSGDWDSPQWLEHAPHPSLLNFAALSHLVELRNWESAAPPPEGLAGKHVFLGAKYGVDDRFPTPVGERYGVDLHAAASASLLQPIADLSDLVGLFVDFLIGLAFAKIVHFFWNGHFEAVSGRQCPAVSRNANRALAPIWLLAFVVVYGGLICLAAAVSFSLLTYIGLWLAPVPIAIGMFIDGFLTGSVEHASERLAEEGHEHSPGVAEEESLLSRSIVWSILLSRTVIFWTVVGVGVFQAIQQLFASH